MYSFRNLIIYFCIGWSLLYSLSPIAWAQQADENTEISTQTETTDPATTPEGEEKTPSESGQAAANNYNPNFRGGSQCNNDSNTGWGIIDKTVDLCDPTLADGGLIVLSVTRFAVSIIGGVVILMVMWGGFLYASSFAMGETDNEDAYKTIQYALMGLVVVLGSYMLISFIQSILTTAF